MKITTKICILDSIFFGLVIISVLPVIQSAQAKELFTGVISADVIEIYDGDTIKVKAQIWLGQSVITRIRLRGIDTPEIRSSCAGETAMAVRAREYLKFLIGSKTVILKNLQYGKYAGRVIADVYIDTRMSLSEALIERGLAVIYTGGKRPQWCQN